MHDVGWNTARRVGFALRWGRCGEQVLAWIARTPPFHSAAATVGDHISGGVLVRRSMGLVAGGTREATVWRLSQAQIAHSQYRTEISGGVAGRLSSGEQLGGGGGGALLTRAHAFWLEVMMLASDATPHEFGVALRRRLWGPQLAQTPDTKASASAERSEDAEA